MSNLNVEDHLRFLHEAFDLVDLVVCWDYDLGRYYKFVVSDLDQLFTYTSESPYANVAIACAFLNLAEEIQIALGIE